MNQIDQYAINALALEPDTFDKESLTYSHQKLRALVSVDDVAKLFSVHVRTAQRWTQRRKIPYYRIGSVIRYDLHQILMNAGHYDE